MPVLAERAAEVTARETRRAYLRAGPEMVEGLFLNWIDREGGNESVKWNVRFSVPVKPDPAAALLAGRQDAAPWAEAALYRPFKRTKKTG